MATGTLNRAVFRELPFMGVIRVNEMAKDFGFRMGDPTWSNLGQGQPEVGDMPGAPPRINTVTIDPEDHAYGPVEGIAELREAVAAHYNRLYRQGRDSQYTAENVAISSGGRLALSRVAAAIDVTRLGYFTPDYTAYEDMLTTFSRFDPVWIELTEATRFHIDPAELESRVTRDALDALLISNPCNPTGAVIAGDELAAWVEIGRRQNTTLFMDEFYSHYVYPETGFSGSVSTAAHVDDVNEDAVVIFDGLTKCYRYPGWRVGWVVGPRDVIRTLTAAGSFLDGGPSRPIQRAAVEVLEPARSDQETQALRTHFLQKRDLTLSMLSEAGVNFPAPAEGTFYAWGHVGDLPERLNTGEKFMMAGFDHRVSTVPGEYFDVNPGRVRSAPSPLQQWVRFSFGPPMDNVRAGLERLVKMIQTSG